jgi:DNA-directed RNA polymerase specialized sigma24 family protein
MRRDEHVDFHLVSDSHFAVHVRLEAWARWIRVRPIGWQTAPMFRQAKSNSFQWHAPQPRVEHNVPEVLEVERAVSLLPEKEREAVRWCYVFPGSPSPVARRLGVRPAGLMELVNRARTMVRNTIRLSDERQAYFTE